MHEPKRTVIEGVVVVVVGTAIALAANAMNPGGLKLGRDYFFDSTPASSSTQPATTKAAPSEPVQGANPVTQAGVVPPAADDPFAGLSKEVLEKLKHFGLEPIRQPQVKALFEDPLYASNVYVIIDAREEKEYAEGHIPGAHHLFYYDFEKYVDEVLPFIQGAEKVIIYCNGGNCEDSVLTGNELRLPKYQLDPSRILVFPEGFESWHKAGLPVERGIRNSNDIVSESPATEGAK